MKIGELFLLGFEPGDFDFLKDFARKLLDSTPEKYLKALQELLTNSGSTENIDDKLM